MSKEARNSRLAAFIERTGLFSEVEIRWFEAVWVLGAHIYALLVPLALIVATYAYWPYLTEITYKPQLLFVAAGLFCAGSAFEVAQNTFDRWYLTSDSPSANGIALSDFLFYWCVTTGQAVCAVALGGDAWWVTLIASVTVLVFPVCYLLQIGHLGPLGAANLLTVYLSFVKFGDPVVFLQILLAAATIYFFTLLLRTGAQVIHGLTTLAASSGVWFFIWALASGATGATHDWMFTLSIAAVAIGTGIALWPALMRLPASPRVVRLSRQ